MLSHSNVVTGGTSTLPTLRYVRLEESVLRQYVLRVIYLRSEKKGREMTNSLRRRNLTKISVKEVCNSTKMEIMKIFEN